MNEFMQVAIDQARQGLAEGGIPIGAALVCDGRVLGAGHNQRVQRGSAILHAEMAALEAAGRLTANVYRRCTLYTTLSPCPMCSGAIVLYGIGRVVIGENKTFVGEEDWLTSHRVEVSVLQDSVCIDLMRQFIRENTELWNEDIGE